MAAKVKPIPDGFEGAIPYLACRGAAAALDFYKKAFGAVETMRLDMPGGMIGHAEIKIGRAVIMLADEYPDMKFLSPLAIGGTPVKIHIYVEDVDAVARKGAQAGAKVTRPVADQFYGDRMVEFECPYGHQWSFATHIEDVPLEEIKARAAAMCG